MVITRSCHKSFLKNAITKTLFDPNIKMSYLQSFSFLAIDSISDYIHKISYLPI